jgi:multidrug efflux pump
VRFSEVCIERPVLASVMSLVLVLFGIISLSRLPNRELPDVDAPIVSVTTIYPGAAPEVVETSVTQPLEDQVIGIEGVRHVTSSSREQVSQISIEFEISRDVEAAANDVRDRVARARRALPEEAEEPVVAKQDADARPIMWLAMSGDGYTQIQLSKIADRRVKDRLGKLEGVATVLVGGERRYSMRLWIDNKQLTARQLTIADVAAALERENVDIPSGRVESADVEFTVRSLGELRTVTAYESLIVATVNGEPVRLRDVARVEVGPEDERKLVRFNGLTALGLGVVKQSKSNTLDVAGAVNRELELLNAELPPGVHIHTAWDASSYIEQSIRDVTTTIFEAVVLVVLVIYLFLRTVRATIIPAVAIPVSIIGSFTILYLTGFTINTLTLMGMTLAIGLVVDDAIVVLENITRWVEEGTPPIEAARRGMKEISFAVVASTISAVAVFLPLTFLQDTTGRLFREFAVTVGAALLISGFVALTLSPALCALVLRRRGKESGVKAGLARGFDSLSNGYGRWLEPVVARPLRWVGVGLGWVALGVGLYVGGALDEELIPNSDRGTVLAMTRAPEGATIEYTDRYQKQAEDILLQDPDVARVFSVVALGIGTPGVVNEGFLWVSLVPREDRERNQGEVVSDLRPRLSAIPGVRAFPFSPSPLRGFSRPVSVVIQGPDIADLKRRSDELVARMEAMPGFSSVESDLYLNKPQLEVAIDRERASDLGVSARDIASTLQILLGGLDVSSFKLDGETYDVIAQLPRFDRSNPRDLVDLYVHGRNGLVSLSQVVEARQTIAPRALPHYDRQRAVTVSARLEDLAAGEALEQVRELATEVVQTGVTGGVRFTFSGDSERFFEAGDALVFAYALAVLVVYLVLAAQFESFVHPLTILVAVALSFTGALVALKAVAGMRDLGWTEVPGTLNLFSKIGLVMLVGLVTKNSILIVEFANQLRDRGHSVRDAILQASRTRFRPILMTALATMAGITPIALGLGAGGESRAPLGVAVVGGMFFSTLLTFFVVPATYVAVARLQESMQRRPRAAERPVAASGR